MPNSGYFDVTFGSSGVLTPVPDGVQSDGSVSYTQGWGPDYELTPGTAGALYPTAGEFNQILYDITKAIQLQQQGLPAPFITSAMNGGTAYSYGQYATVIYNGVAYISNVSGNTDTPPSSKWNAITLSSPNQFTAGTSTGSANAQVLASLSPSVGFSTSVNGQTITFTPGFTNTGSTTLAITSPSVAATTIQKLSGGSLVNLTGGELVASAIAYVTYDMAAGVFVLQSGPSLGTMASLNIGNNLANDTNGNAVATVPPLSLTGANKTFTLGEWGAQISRSNSGTAMADTLPGTSGALPSGWYAEIQNTDSSAADVVSVGLGGSIYYGNQNLSSSGLIILPGETWAVFSQGSGAYVVQRISAAQLTASPVQSAFKGLTAAWASNTTFTLAANEIVLEDSNGNTRKIKNFSQTINSATSGAGGLDTGTVAASAWYFGYAIFNPSTGTQKGLMSASPTSPTLPSGYTLASGPLTAALTDGSSNFIGFTQIGRNWQYQVGNNLSNNPPNLWSGVIGTFGSAWASVSVANYVPTQITAKVSIYMGATLSSANGAAVAPNSSWYTGAAPITLATGLPSESTLCGEIVLESTSIAVQSQTNVIGRIYGFELNI